MGSTFDDKYGDVPWPDLPHTRDFKIRKEGERFYSPFDDLGVALVFYLEAVRKAKALPIREREETRYTLTDPDGELLLSQCADGSVRYGSTLWDSDSRAGRIIAALTGFILEDGAEIEFIRGKGKS